MAFDLHLVTCRSDKVPTAKEVEFLHVRLREELDACAAWSELSVHKLDAARALWFLKSDGLFDPKCKEAFEGFCARFGLLCEPLTEEIALRFVAHSDGIHVATVSLPRDSTRDIVLRSLLEFARTHKLRVFDPQAGRELQP